LMIEEVVEIGEMLEMELEGLIVVEEDNFS